MKQTFRGGVIIRIRFKDYIEECSSVTHSTKSNVVCAMAMRNQYILYYKTSGEAQNVYNEIFTNGCYDASEDDYDCRAI